MSVVYTDRAMWKLLHFADLYGVKNRTLEELIPIIKEDKVKTKSSKEKIKLVDK